MKKLKLAEHPTVKRVMESNKADRSDQPLNADWLRRLTLDCGADDCGLVEIDRPALANEHQEILSRYPWTKTLVAFVLKMNLEPIRSPARSVANTEMHGKIEDINHVGGKIVARLERHGIRAVNPAGGFPMEMSRFPGRIWIVSHKLVAEQAGLGHMGIHRNVIAPKFGNFILLGTLLIDRETSAYDHPLDFNPCLECNLCVAVCPVGAVSAEGEFNFSACFTHNYREFLGGFNDWVEQIADSKNGLDYRRRVAESETSSFWQSLAFGPNYKSAYCMAVCPAGEEVIPRYLANPKQHTQEVVKPLQNKVEEIYVVPKSDAEAHTRRRFQHKRIKYAANGLHPRSIDQFLDALPYMFQKQQSNGIEATYHFTFSGKESRRTTITIARQQIAINDGQLGKANLKVWADSETWLGFIAGERNLILALATLRIRLLGSPLWLLKFGKCFPSSGIRHVPTPSWREPALAQSTRPVFLRNDPDSGKIAEFSNKDGRWSGDLVVNQVVEETPNVKTFRLLDPGSGDLPFTYLPGQFLTLHLKIKGQSVNRSYTISSSPTRAKHLEITVKRESRGLVSNYLHNEIGVGDKLSLSAPSGRFTFIGKTHASIVLVSAGVGMTPAMSIVRYLCDQDWSGKIFVISGFRGPKEFIFREELTALARQHANLHLFITMSRPDIPDWSGPVGRIDREYIARSVPDIAQHRVHICGPTKMMDSVKTALLELGANPRNLILESFGTDKRTPKPKTEKPAGTPIVVHCARSGEKIAWTSAEYLLEAEWVDQPIA